uniref:Uncharacterized protein n=1 Tax=Solanum lycopersicum TaxID=4081 RepID=A0A3Q7J7E6_SOLLC
MRDHISTNKKWRKNGPEMSYVNGKRSERQRLGLYYYILFRSEGEAPTLDLALISSELNVEH